MPSEQLPGLTAHARAAATPDDLARLLVALRTREARHRGGAELSYRHIAGRTGWSVAAVGAYLTGTRLPSEDRLAELAELLGADPAEQDAIVSARGRVAEMRRLAAALRGADRTAPRTAVAPRTLPAPVSGFTGRDAHLAALDRVLVAGPEAGPIVISAVTGMGGVGKTALAVHWAHRVAARFPDGQLYVDLRGYDATEPLSTMEALSVLLSAFGAGRNVLPPDLAGRSALYHRLLRNRSVLVLLDNANAAAQARPLLPPPPCVAVVTSRDDLRDLVPVDAPGRLTLDVLTEAEAVTLLRTLVADRAAHEPGATRALARHCGRLPLALRVAAEHVTSRPGVLLSDFVAELRDTGAELDAFETTSDDRSDVRAVFSWSLRHLPAPAARTFQLLGLVPGHDVDVAGLAALAAVRPAEAGELADTLTRAHLIGPHGPGRISMHDLLRAFAAESCERALPAADRTAAVTGLLDHYLATAKLAVDRLFPLNLSARPDACPPVDPAPTAMFADVAAAAAWLASERTNLVRACVHAQRNGWPRHAITLALVLRPFLDDGYHEDALTVHSAALSAAEALGDGCDPADRAGVYRGLGITNWRLGRLDLAAAQLRLAVDENVRVGNAAGATVSIAALGLVHDALGNYREALRCQERGLLIARSTGVRMEEGIQLINLGYSHVRLEQYDCAADLYQQALAHFEQSEAHWGVAQARYGLAVSLEGLGQHDEALAHANESLAISRSFAQVNGSLRVLATIGSIQRRLGRLADAVNQLTGALRECREFNNPRPTAQVLNALGETYRDAGDHTRALACHTEARDLAEQTGDRAERTRALVGLGDAQAAAGETDRARESWRLAYDAYAESGLPAAARVRARWVDVRPGPQRTGT